MKKVAQKIRLAQRMICDFTQPLWGMPRGYKPPMVAEIPQPWAGRQNPVGIQSPPGEVYIPSCRLPRNMPRMPQRGFINQPRVAATPLLWDTVSHIINPDGVASEEGHPDAAIIIVRSYPSGVFYESPRTFSSKCGPPERNARLFGRGLEEARLRAGHHRRRGRSCASPLPTVADALAGRLGEGDQTRIQHLGQAARPRAGGVRVARGIWSFFGQRFRYRQDARLHFRSRRAPQTADLSRRIPRVPAQTHHGMGRAFCVGMTQPRWGSQSCFAGTAPRVAEIPQPWAGRRNPVGIQRAATATPVPPHPNGVPYLSPGLPPCGYPGGLWACQWDTPTGLRHVRTALKGKLPTAKQLSDVVRAALPEKTGAARK